MNLANPAVLISQMIHSSPPIKDNDVETGPPVHPLGGRHFSCGPLWSLVQLESLGQLGFELEGFLFPGMHGCHEERDDDDDDDHENEIVAAEDGLLCRNDVRQKASLNQKIVGCIDQ